MIDVHRSSNVFLAVHKTDGKPGNLMYILVEDRSVFDLIDLPEGGNEKVRTKAISHDGQYVVFQYWLPVQQELTAKSQRDGS